MRKILIKCLLIILIIMTSVLIISGLGNREFGIESFVKLQKETAKLYSTVYDLQEKNTLEYESKKQNLIDATNNYKKLKAEYERLVPLIQGVGGTSNNKFDLYDIDFLWTIIGNYATQEGVVLQFDVSKTSNDIAFFNTDFVLCNLNFKVSGEYVSISDFIDNLEDDERLNFEIRDFTLKKVEDDLQATFVVKSTPINKTNLSIAVQ